VSDAEHAVSPSSAALNLLLVTGSLGAATPLYRPKLSVKFALFEMDVWTYSQTTLQLLLVFKPPLMSIKRGEARLRHSACVQTFKHRAFVLLGVCNHPSERRPPPKVRRGAGRRGGSVRASELVGQEILTLWYVIFLANRLDRILSNFFAGVV
jgi:hypothetical protein